MTLDVAIRWSVSLLVVGAATTEVLQLETVMRGLEVLGYPAYLVWILAPAKLLAAAALLLRPYTLLARAAWLGLALNLAGAVASFALAGVAPLPDAVVAPAYLGLILLGAWQHERVLAGMHSPRLSPRPVAPVGALLAAAALSSPAPSLAAEPVGASVTDAATPVEAADRRSPWLRDPGRGVETSVLWPVYPGLFFQLRTQLGTPVPGGAVMLGTQLRVPTYRETEGTFSNTDLVAGWRQLTWLGLHVEGNAAVGWGRLRDSTRTGLDYDSLDVELQALVGWRQEVGRFYGVLQPVGLAAVVYRSNPWPVAGEGVRRSEPPIYMGNVVVGVSF
jgi:hypothetical protein